MRQACTATAFCRSRETHPAAASRPTLPRPPINARGHQSTSRPTRDLPSTGHPARDRIHPASFLQYRITDRLPCRGRRSSAAASDLLSPAPSLKSRLADGDTLYVLFLLSFSRTLAALAGYDYVVVDMEHGLGRIPEALACLRVLDAARTPAVLCLPEASAVWAKKALDLGPAGLILPAIESPEAAAEAVETATAIAKIDANATVDGVDVVQMGPLDLSASMGYLWDLGNRKVRATLREAERKVLEAKKKKKAAAASGGNAAYLGGFAMQKAE
uniref:HpcH/HpaI aldolase/citrate lyase domain-containing protein n=1 Tax=Zea mays TaxID=4577 RepID=A0A804QUU7_MAIZE